MNKFTIFAIVFHLFFMAACVSTSTLRKPYKVQIVDAESGAPISGAAIDVHYLPNRPESPSPNHPHAVANAQGEVTIQSMKKPALWQVQANKYIEQRLFSNEGNLPPRYAVLKVKGVDGIVHLYQSPEPQLTIGVSNTYTGPITINLQPAPGFAYNLVDPINQVFMAVDPQASYIQDAPGKRVFTATASLDGVVTLATTPLLYDIKAPNLHIQDSTGVLPYHDLANSQATGRGVWGQLSEDDKQLHHQIRLFVGTRQAYQAFLSRRE